MKYQIPQPLLLKLAQTANSWGDECCGGAGQERHPITGERYGEPYYELAQAILTIYPTTQKTHGERVEARQRQTYLNGEAGLREWQAKNPGKTCS